MITSHDPGASVQADLRRPVLTVAALGAAGIALVGAASAIGPLPGLVSLTAVALGLTVVRRPELGALVLAAVAPAISGLARGLPVPGLRASEILVVGVASLILLTSRERQAVPWRAFDWLALAYVLATAILGGYDVLRRGEPITTDAAGTLLGPLQFFLIYRAVLTALPSAEQRRRALALILLLSIPVSLLAILQQYDVGPARSIVVTLTGSDIYATTLSNPFGFAESTPRATGPFPHWHDLGGYLLIIVLLGAGLLLEGSGRVLRTRTVLAVSALALVALVQTVSLAPMLGLLAGLLMLGLWTQRRAAVVAWVALGLVVTGLLFAPLLESRLSQQFRQPNGDVSFVPQTIAYRYYVWQQFVPVVERHAMTGYGPELPPGLYFPHSESLYVELMLRGGLPLLAVYLALMWSLARRSLATARDADPDRRVVGRVVLTLVFILAFIQLIATYFIDSGPPHLLWALAGLLVHDRRDVHGRDPHRGRLEARVEIK